jgi:hypothetical protein
MKSVGDYLRERWDDLLEDDRVEMIDVVLDHKHHTELRADLNLDHSIEMTSRGLLFRTLPVRILNGQMTPEIRTRSSR